MAKRLNNKLKVLGPVHKGHPRFYEIIREMADLHDRKNEEYTKGSKGGPLSNFARTSTIMQLYPGMDWDSPFGVALCYMLKQLDSALIMRSTKRDSIVGEPIKSRLRDVQVYTILAEILLGEETTVRALSEGEVGTWVGFKWASDFDELKRVRPMPKRKGKTITFKRYPKLKLPTKALREGRKPGTK